MLRSSKIFSVFPPPALLNVRCAGLHISDDAVHAIVLSSAGNTYSVVGFVERVLAKGIVEGGAITNPNLLAQELKAIKEKLKLSNVRVSLPEERMYLFNISMPNVTDEGSKDVVESKLEENIPIPPAEVIYEFDVCERKKELITEVSVSAFPEKLIQSYIACCTLAGLEVKGFDTEPRALIRSLVPTKNETAIIIDIANSSTSMYIVKNNVAQFSSTIAIGGKETVGTLTEEVSKIISYWKSREEGDEIKKAYILGTFAQGEGVVSLFEKTLKIDVLLGNVWSGLQNKDIVPPIEFGQSLDYGVAIGLALNE
jgi:Tfp pilus assembly PilM family ATPase